MYIEKLSFLLSNAIRLVLNKYYDAIIYNFQTFIYNIMGNGCSFNKFNMSYARMIIISHESIDVRIMSITKIDDLRILISNSKSSTIWICSNNEFMKDLNLIRYLEDIINSRKQEFLENIVITSNFTKEKVMFSREELIKHLSFK